MSGQRSQQQREVVVVKRITFFTALTVVMSSLVGLGSIEARAQENKWNVPLIWNPPHHVRTAQDSMVKRIAERTKGKVNISLHQYGELGLVDSDVLSIVRTAQVPVAELDHSKTAGDEPLFQIFNLPGLAFSIEDAMTIAKATEELRRKALDERDALEIGLAHFNPPQGIFTKQPVKTVADLKDLRIRVYSGVLQRSFELLGARPQLIPWGDTPAALLQGVVQGAITSPSSGISAGFADTTKYMTTMPLSNRISWIMNKKTWASLSPDNQKILREEFDQTAKAIQANWNSEESGVADLVSKAKMTYVAPSKEFQAAVTKLLRPVWEEWAAKTKYGPEALKLSLAALGRS
ncbi:MAG: TRAP transporter substrate-binding protein DctP [Proteobacteria bacterium]|nr:TRAP transporter substrate-binding protein DctP [Pseudomonadota bacterium]